MTNTQGSDTDDELNKALNSIGVFSEAQARTMNPTVHGNYTFLQEGARIKLRQAIKDLIASNTNQLIDELLSELPTSNCQRHWADDFAKDCTCDLMSRDQVTAILEKKKGL